MATREVKTRITAKKLVIKELFDAMQYCPICGEVLWSFGGPQSELKQCRNQHGLMSITGRKSGQLLGMTLELPYDQQGN